MFPKPYKKSKEDSMNGKDLRRRQFLKYTAGSAAALWASSQLPSWVKGNQAFAADKPSYDILIQGGTVYDGTLRPPFIADIGIKGDKIKAIGTLDGKAIKIIQAKGFIVTPGFIDIHEHSDMMFTGSSFAGLADLADKNPATREELKGNYNALFQGVTTVVTGNCGGGFTDVTRWFKTLESMKFGTLFRTAIYGMNFLVRRVNRGN
jgi:hypothetical protein